ncbi:hypothetical protein B7939_01125 [Eggerthia catenaformis]|nr:hypothetical protein B7939_01125 [Eggerthia catenaformis]
MTTQTLSRLHIDLETYCELDLSKVGVYAYASHPSFDILLFAYAYDDDPVRIIDMTCESIPDQVLSDLTDESVIKVAHNAAFEMTCLENYLMLEIDPHQWEDTMVMAMQQGLPASLAQVGEVLSLDRQKMSIGKALITYFCKPCKATRTNGQRTRNLPHHDPDKWEAFKSYCLRDVEVEKTIYMTLAKSWQPEIEKDIWCLDQEINRRGILTDTKLVNNAVALDQSIAAQNTAALSEIVHSSNPNSTAQFKQWLNRKKGLAVTSFTKTTAKELLESTDDPEVKRAIELKLMLSKTSVKKYEAIQRADNGDHRMRGLFQYYGANRTGRWAGRLVQLQNLPQNHIEELDFARELVRERDQEVLEIMYDSVPDILSQLIRTAFIPRKGCKFIVADYSAIEARVIAWLAGETWRQRIFADNGDIYCASASQMFGVPVIKHGINGHLRQKGKIAELALGYGGGPAAMKQFGADRLGMSEADIIKTVKLWRAKSPHITKLWNDVGNAVMDIIDNEASLRVLNKNVRLKKEGRALVIVLPSGRKLYYQDAIIRDGERGARIEYRGVNQTSRKYEMISTWGGKLVENIIQAIARDVLAMAMLRLDAHGYHIVGHIHDEVIIEADMTDKVEDVCDIMCRHDCDWMKGLILNAAGYEGSYYFKD